VNPPTSDAFAGLANQECFPLTTFQSDGTPVTTPRLAGTRRGHLFVYMPIRSGKRRRPDLP
jgi:hypothetical protein